MSGKDFGKGEGGDPYWMVHNYCITPESPCQQSAAETSTTKPSWLLPATWMVLSDGILYRGQFSLFVEY